jgi:hypothetical protein
MSQKTPRPVLSILILVAIASILLLVSVKSTLGPSDNDSNEPSTTQPLSSTSPEVAADTYTKFSDSDLGFEFYYPSLYGSVKTETQAPYESSKEEDALVEAKETPTNTAKLIYTERGSDDKALFATVVGKDYTPPVPEEIDFKACEKVECEKRINKQGVAYLYLDTIKGSQMLTDSGTGEYSAWFFQLKNGKELILFVTRPDSSAAPSTQEYYEVYQKLADSLSLISE